MARKHRIAVILAIPLVLLGLYALVSVLPFHDIIRWIRGRGVEGIAVFFALFLILNLLALPSTIVFVGAGLLYGTLWGTVLTTIGSIIVELLVSALFRTRARRWFERHTENNTKLAAIDRAVSENSFSVLWLLRLSPAVPFGVLNYAIAPMEISFGRRLAANLLGMGPCNLVQAYLGSMLAGVGGLSKAAPGPWKWLLLVGGIVTAIAAFAITTVASKRVLGSGKVD